MAKSTKRTKQQPGARFHIPGVHGSTKLSALTVDQFIELMVQITSQVAQAHRLPDPEVFEEAFQQVRKIIDKQKGGSVIDDVVQTAQHVVLEKMGEMREFISKSSRRGKDAGPSPHAAE